MREIKFRGLGADGKWWFGESNPSGENHVNLATFFANIHAGAIRPETVGEWAGLKDKHGKEIYEADIIHQFGGRNHIVEFSNCAFRAGEYVLKEIHQSEVIGNIYENPKLIASTIKREV